MGHCYSVRSSSGHSRQPQASQPSLLLILAAVVGVWTKVNTGTFLGTIGFAYLSFVMFILFFFGLVIFQSAVNEELGLRKCPWLLMVASSTDTQSHSNSVHSMP